MTRPTIAFDGGVLGVRPHTGVARAFLATLTAYAHTADVRCLLLVPPDAGVAAVEGVILVHTEAVAGRLARQLALPRLLAKRGADLLHSAVAALPWRAPCPMLATVHDLPWRAAVRLDEPGTGLRHRAALRVAARRAAVIVVPSRATRDALAAELRGRGRARVHVVPHGVPLPCEPAPESALTGPFLAFGDGRPRKNVERLRRAHARARADRPDLPPLRVVGPGLEWLSDDERDAALRSARALVAVSLHEGFGLPVLEALGQGVPVVCSASSSMQEIAAGAALAVDPTDEAAIASAFIHIHVDAELRAGLRRRGLARAAELTPAHAASHWRSIHAECLA